MGLTASMFYKDLGITMTNQRSVSGHVIRLDQSEASVTWMLSNLTSRDVSLGCLYCGEQNNSSLSLWQLHQHLIVSIFREDDPTKVFFRKNTMLSGKDSLTGPR